MYDALKPSHSSRLRYSASNMINTFASIGWAAIWRNTISGIQLFRLTTILYAKVTFVGAAGGYGLIMFDFSCNPTALLKGFSMPGSRLRILACDTGGKGLLRLS